MCWCPVAQGMKSDVLGQILAKMNPDAAQKLTVKLANKLALPQTAEAPARRCRGAAGRAGRRAAAERPADSPRARKKPARQRVNRGLNVLNPRLTRALANISVLKGS